MNIRSLFLVAAMLFSQLALAASNQFPKQTTQRWLDARWIELDIRDNQNDWQGNWQIAFDHQSNSVKIDKDDLFNSHRLQGSLIVLEGHTLLSKGLDLKPGYEIDALDTPVLMTQLLLSLLQKAVATDPASLKGQFIVQHQENTIPIRVATKSASALFQAPWQVNGELNKHANQNILFQLEFQTSLAKDIPYRVYMSGKLNHHATPPIKEDMSLQGWTIYSLGPETAGQYSYGAKKINSSASTINELRKELSH